MSDHITKREGGFTLLEMTIALALGTIVLGAAVQIYSQGVTATWVATQRSELQQDFRAASDILTADLGLAGAGLGNGAEIELPTSSTIPVYGCDQTGTCYLNGTSAKYPTQSGTPYLYGLLPGYDLGPTMNGQATDIVTVAYTDPDFFLDCYTATIASATTVTFALNSSGPNCTANGDTIQAINDAAEGLTAGDLVLFNFSGTQVVAEVYGSAPTSTTVTFASSDPLSMNQASTSTASLACQFAGNTGCSGGTTGYGVRLFVITYYIDTTVTPARLMRQVSGHSPMPIAEGAAYMKFTYDLFNTATNAFATQCPNPGASGDVCNSGSDSGLLPNQITKINIQNMAMDSTLKGALYGLSKGDQSIDLETSVCARNLTYVNNFNNQ